MKLSSNGKVKMIKIKFSVLSESYFTPALTQAGHFVKRKKSGFRNGYLIYICLSLSFSQNFSAHSSELLKGLKIIQRFLKYPQII